MVSPPVRQVLLPFPQRGATIANLIVRPALQPYHAPFSPPFARADAAVNFTPSYSRSISTSPLTTRTRPAPNTLNPASTSPLKAAIGLRGRGAILRRLSVTSINQKDSQSRTIDRTQSATLLGSRSGNANSSDVVSIPEGAINASSQPESHVAIEKHTPSSSLEKGTKAGRLNLRARLSKEKDEPRKWSTLKEIWRLLRIARRETWPLLGAVALLLISSAVTISVPLTIGRVMNLATSDSAETKIFGLTLYQFFPALALVFTIGAAANFGRIVLLRVIGERVVSRLRSLLYRKTLAQEGEFFDANKVGDLTSRFIADTTIVGKSITQNVSDGLRSIISCTASFIAMAWISPSLVLTIFLAAPFIGAGTVIYSRVARRLATQSQKALGALNKIGNERLESIRTVQAFAGESQEVGRYNTQVRKLFNIGKTQALTDARFFALNGWLGNMIVIGLLWHGGSLVREGFLTLGDLTTFMMYAVYAGTSVIGVTSFLSELMKGVGAATRLFELEDRKPAIPPTRGIPVRSAKGLIEFSDVSFAYPTRPDNQIFKDMSFSIPGGSNVCIVGPSGGGKSTVTSLLLRFYEVNSGTIRVNGVDISTMNAKQLRRCIGVVAQEPVLFSGTIAENIAYSNPRADRAAIVQAASRANCTFISKLQKGLDTEVGSRGTQLSGGQKQRIAIARALLKNPDILILDEATSALDAESEVAVNAALARLMGGNMTTISIAHRLSTIKRSDIIIVLNNEGSVAETGSYTQLSADKDSAFSKLMEWQMTGGENPHPPAPPYRPPHEPETVDEEFEALDEEEVDEEDKEGEKRPR
ncbi:P-loop containing nucleoside triphosphate hydrolase protein [Xylaria bambusicola]|uniref:P-loop containing nucleoside triphosphate hydrolase protein n=1 Tax=Xylaria bambusicola TaxID=326684 RepID=UPI002007FBB3|nr:P-loop containing nucleoside triphosphate hydrolase protein [Xylaria bambusicola]KAI0515363.1 P-loop containing nucleoside triphosphate hydrolase protein [Xylaria bambusicola]